MREMWRTPSGRSYLGALIAAVVAMLVGSIGLIVAVPLTAAIAAALVAKLDPSDLEATSGHHG